jgi:hypothetical protein
MQSRSGLLLRVVLAQHEHLRLPPGDRVRGAAVRAQPRLLPPARVRRRDRLPGRVPSRRAVPRALHPLRRAVRARLPGRPRHGARLPLWGVRAPLPRRDRPGHLPVPLPTGNGGLPTAKRRRLPRLLPRTLSIWRNPGSRDVRVRPVSAGMRAGRGARPGRLPLPVRPRRHGLRRRTLRRPMHRGRVVRSRRLRLRLSPRTAVVRGARVHLPGRSRHRTRMHGRPRVLHQAGVSGRADVGLGPVRLRLRPVPGERAAGPGLVRVRMPRRHGAVRGRMRPLLSGGRGTRSPVVRVRHVHEPVSRGGGLRQELRLRVPIGATALLHQGEPGLGLLRRPGDLQPGGRPLLRAWDASMRHGLLRAGRGDLLPGA